MQAITMRSRVRVQWTTEPAVMGYADTVERQQARQRFESRRPDYVGTPRGVLAYMAKQTRNLGGAHHAVRLIAAADGSEISMHDLRMLVNVADSRKR